MKNHKRGKTPRSQKLMEEKTKILTSIRMREKPQDRDILKRHSANRRSLLLSFRTYRELVLYHPPTK